ncbi:hypothetical protein [Bizionia myxarmorum]|uniref:Uncharacterized protein n=1 Tax=Bizionia myxarmorum TaxID=291186 RepID=A0A5D0RE95_9FLAO|nr:hypothetical protein [Bizionia myxarmorum]TYB79832.1 hypothetical protein ES674_08815 [Bizionia myxarmorum]
MRKLILLLLTISVFTSCDDGDIINIEFDFDDTFSACGELVFYQIKDNPYESLSLKITDPRWTLEKLIAIDTITGQLINDQEIVIDIGLAGNQFNYRSYNADPRGLFCNDVPPSNIQILEDLSSVGGKAYINVTLVEDDLDGIPAEFEDENTDGDNNPATNPKDTDGDGIPDYLDVDDDGDNVLTSVELDDNADGDNDPRTNPRDTDEDGIPDYLDSDDDQDLVPTINEESRSADQNPANDYSSPGIADYLNKTITDSVPATAYRANQINQVFKITLRVEGVSFSTITQDLFIMGTLVDSRLIKTRSITPEF